MIVRSVTPQFLQFQTFKKHGFPYFVEGHTIKLFYLKTDSFFQYLSCCPLGRENL